MQRQHLPFVLAARCACLLAHCTPFIECFSASTCKSHCAFACKSSCGEFAFVPSEVHHWNRTYTRDAALGGTCATQQRWLPQGERIIPARELSKGTNFSTRDTTTMRPSRLQKMILSYFVRESCHSYAHAWNSDGSVRQKCNVRYTDACWFSFYFGSFVLQLVLTPSFPRLSTVLAGFVLWGFRAAQQEDSTTTSTS